LRVEPPFQVAELRLANVAGDTPALLTKPQQPGKVALHPDRKCYKSPLKIGEHLKNCSSYFAALPLDLAARAMAISAVR
jgi:hypothetical protein